MTRGTLDDVPTIITKMILEECNKLSADDSLYDMSSEMAMASELELLEDLRANPRLNDRIQELRTKLYGPRVDHNVTMQLSYRHDPIRNGMVVQWVGNTNIGQTYYFKGDKDIVDQAAWKLAERELERHGNWVAVVPDLGTRVSKYLALPDEPEVHAALQQMFGGS